MPLNGNLIATPELSERSIVSFVREFFFASHGRPHASANPNFMGI